MTGAVRYILSLIVQNLNLMDLEETSIDINDYIAEEAPHLFIHITTFFIMIIFPNYCL